MEMTANSGLKCLNLVADKEETQLSQETGLTLIKECHAVVNNQSPLTPGSQNKPRSDYS